MTDAPELLPPDGEPKGWHWLKAPDGRVTMAQCLTNSWSVSGSLLLLKNAWKRGYRYHAPARPDDATERARLEEEITGLEGMLREKSQEVARLREALEQCADYFDNRADAEYFTDSAIPVVNDEMHMLTVVREALRHDR